jgi:LuxR family maltose regulon positive regulatory protein
MARLDPAIRHAITPPEFEGKLHRELLVDRLHGAIPKKLVAIAAPAGYGKTTLLADFIAHTEVPFCWLQVTMADRDVMRLASLILASLEQRFRRLRDQLDLRAFVDSSPESIASAIARLVESEIPETFVLILDDVHILHSAPPALAFLDRLILTLPNQAVVFAAGREVLEVSIARLMAEGNLSGFGPQDLSLSRGEISELFELVDGRTPNHQVLETIYEETRGWVTGVVLSDLSGSSMRLGVGLPEDLAYEYLGSVVLNRQPEALRKFLLEASVLPIISPEICDFLLRRSDSEAVLDEIAEKGLFISKTIGKPTTYEFHPMFRALLLETLKASDPDRYSHLRERAADRLSQEDPETAISIHIDARDEDAAAPIVEDVADEMFRLGRYTTLENWLAAFSDPAVQVPNLLLLLAGREKERGRYEEALGMLGDVLSNRRIGSSKRSIALAHKANVLLRLGRFDTVGDLIDQAERLSKQVDDPILSGHILRVKSLSARLLDDDPDKAASLLSESVRQIEQGGDSYLLMSTYQDLATVYGMSGSLSEAKRATEKSLELALEWGSPNAQSAAANNLAQIEFLEGRYEEALLRFSRARSLAAQADNFIREAAICFGQAEVFSDLGLTLQAAELCEEGLDLASSAGDPTWLAYGCLISGVLHRRANGFRLASEWLKRGIELGNGVLETSLNIQLAAIAAQSDPGGSAGILNRLLDSETQTLDAQQESLSWLFLSYCYLRMGRREDAEAAFRHCLDIVSLRQAGQFVSAELRAYPELCEWAEGEFVDDPIYQRLAHRIDIMDAMERHYRPAEPADEETGVLVQAFGETRVIVEGNVVVDLKPLALEVFLLLVDKGSAERDMLADMFWPDHPVGRQTANLHMAIYNIRGSLGKDLVRLDGSVYRLNPDVSFRYDVAEFERAVDIEGRMLPGDPRRIFVLTEAVNLYRGRFMPEFFSDWVETKRRQLEFQYLEVVAEHAEEALLRDQPRRALDSLRGALTVDPYRDDLNEAYIRALARLGRRSDVLNHYIEYKRLLQDEFGLEPSESIRGIYEAMVSRS